MKKIRQGVFETNSSSTHSISINENTEGILDTIYTDSDGVIRLEGGDFGWEWQRYNDAETKANYCFSDVTYNDWQDNDKLVIKDQEKYDMLVKVIKDHTGAKHVEFEQKGYGIDHQSKGTASDAFASEETLKNFLFDPQSVLFTGNDNEEGLPNFFDAHDLEYSFKLEVEGTDQVFKFEKIPTEEQVEEAIIIIMSRHPLNKYASYSGHRDAKWSFLTYDQSTTDDEKYNSLSRLADGIITIFKDESIYDKSGKFLGTKINDTKDLKFKIVKV